PERARESAASGTRQCLPADRGAPAPLDGNAGRKPLSRYALRVRQPEPLLAQRPRLLPEEGWDRLPRGRGREAVRGRRLQRYRPGPAGARCRGEDRLAPRRADHAAERLLRRGRAAQHGARAGRTSASIPGGAVTSFPCWCAARCCERSRADARQRTIRILFSPGAGARFATAGSRRYVSVSRFFGKRRNGDLNTAAPYASAMARPFSSAVSSANGFVRTP